jgi:hypothetical protein
MQTVVVVEADDIGGDIDLGLRVVGILALPHPFHFEIQEEAFGNCIDAPMSRNHCGHGQIRQDYWIKLPYNVSLQAAMNFLVGHAFRRST